VRDSIQINKTTKDDVRKLFGSAKEIVSEEAGYEIWIYKNYDASAAVINHVFQYVPFVALVNKSPELVSEDVKRELVILFDANGVVKKSRLLVR
jgi:hypothetical protein